MRVVIVAHTADENGWHKPGEILDLRKEIAEEYIAKQWAIAVVEEVAAEKELSSPPPVETADMPGASETTHRHYGAKAKKNI